MKVLIISFNQERFPDPVFPLGSYIIAKSLSNHQHEVEIIDLNLTTIDNEMQKIMKFQPDVIGISVRNIDNILYPNFKSYLSQLKDLVKKIKEYTKCLIVLGGSGFSVMPQEILQLTNADYGIVGAGERVFPKFLELLQNKALPTKRILKDSDTPLEQEFKYLKNHVSIDRKFNFDWYYQWGGCMNISTKRGCPHNCIFCTYPLIEGRKYKLRDPMNVVDEIQHYLENKDIKHFFFTDSVFNDPIDHSIAISEEIIRRKLSVSWGGFFNPSNLTKDNLKIFKHSGCDSIDLGVDSGNDIVLRCYGKNYDAKTVANVIQFCHSNDMPVAVNLLLGGPGETEETLAETFELLEKTSPTLVSIFIGMRIYPDTPVYNLAFKEGIINTETDLMKPIFYIAPVIKDSIFELVKAKVATRPNWAVPGMGLNINPERSKMARGQGLKGSLLVPLKRLLEKTR